MKDFSMKVSELPAGSAPVPLSSAVFPRRWQNFIWRNWGLIPPDRLAAVLRAPEEEVLRAAAEMGLPHPGKISCQWITRGYLTLIRNNWHLLNYEQLLELLDWTPEKMAYTLKEEDFFWHKLGNLKPACPELRMTPLDDEEKKRTAHIREVVQKFFPPENYGYLEEPFSFADKFGAKPGAIKKKSPFDFSFIHSYAASCGDVLGEAETNDPVPENLMAQYSSMGITGVWFHAILYLLCPIPGAEEFSLNWEKRLENLKKITSRCRKYGLKVYLYLNEPRCMPESFYQRKPRWRGIFTRNAIANCTTRAPEILEYLENALEMIFTAVPDLGGIFTITKSENATSCCSGGDVEKCPYCSKVPQEKIIADINTAMERGMHRAAPEAEMIFYDWAWRGSSQAEEPAEFKKRVMDLLPNAPHCHVNCVSEWGLETTVGGIKGYLQDYSISQTGPSPESEKVWRHAASLGLGRVAKVQINNSWELAAVPYLPVPYLIREHLEKLQKAGVSALMLSWTLGGYPGGNLELLGASPEEIAAARFTPDTAEKVCRAWKYFSEGFRNFPFCVGTAYNAPTNFGPMNQLHLTPTGYTSTMVGFPYDYLKGWRSIYPEEVFEEQFRLVTTIWKKGLELLDDAALLTTDEERDSFEEVRHVATAAYCHLNACYQQVRFTAARDHGADTQIMAECAQEELENTLCLYEICRRDSRIGFEASNHYFYTLNDLREKVLNCLYIVETLERRK